MVGYVAPDGAAAKAGIREGDQVVQIDDIANPNLGRYRDEGDRQRAPADAGLGEARRRSGCISP